MAGFSKAHPVCAFSRIAGPWGLLVNEATFVVASARLWSVLPILFDYVSDSQGLVGMRE